MRQTTEKHIFPLTSKISCSSVKLRTIVKPFQSCANSTIHVYRMPQKCCISLKKKGSWFGSKESSFSRKYIRFSDTLRIHVHMYSNMYHCNNRKLHNLYIKFTVKYKFCTYIIYIFLIYSSCLISGCSSTISVTAIKIFIKLRSISPTFNLAILLPLCLSFFE